MQSNYNNVHFSQNKSTFLLPDVLQEIILRLHWGNVFRGQTLSQKLFTLKVVIKIPALIVHIERLENQLKYFKVQR